VEGLGKTEWQKGLGKTVKKVLTFKLGLPLSPHTHSLRVWAEALLEHHGVTPLLGPSIPVPNTGFFA